jgi:hypothetical protein
MTAFKASLLLAFLALYACTAYAQLAGGRPGLRQQILRQQQKRDRQEKERRERQAEELQQRMVQRVSRTDPSNTALPGGTTALPADGPYVLQDPAGQDSGPFYPSVFNGVLGPYSSSSSSGPRLAGMSSSGPGFVFGWVSVSLDERPEEEYDEVWQQPKMWNYRCYKACSRYVKKLSC